MNMDEYTVEGLTAILRGRNPERRAAAAIELGNRHDLQAVESLIRAHNEDPEESVRKAARTALSELLGGEAETAIQAYGADADPDDPWLRAELDEHEEQLFGWEDEEDEPDLDGASFNELIRSLRGQNPKRRTQAAAALGNRHDTRAVEYLIRSYLEDPEEDVQDAAFEALEDLLGSQAKMAIAAYRPDPEIDGVWIRDEDEDAVQGYPRGGVDSASSGWDEEDLLGFISILRAGGDPAIRVRAIQELKTIRDMRAMDAIATMAVWSDEDVLQSEARKAMDELFGEESPKVLESYRKHGMYVVDEERFREEIDDLRMESGDDEEIEDQDWIEAPLGTEPVLIPPEQRKQEPVTREEKAGWGSAVLIGLAVIVIVVMALYLLRG